MIKVVVFDGGYGGEILADRLEKELPVIEVIRVIDWRNAESLLQSTHAARRVAVKALKPYAGRVDLIIVANYLVSLSGLKFLRKAFPHQKIIGLKLPQEITNESGKRPLILATQAVLRTPSVRKFLIKLRLRGRIRVVVQDTWPSLIDDGELDRVTIELALREKGIVRGTAWKEILLLCSQFYDIVPDLRQILGTRIKISDGLDATIREAEKVLKIRGRITKRK